MSAFLSVLLLVASPSSTAPESAVSRGDVFLADVDLIVSQDKGFYWTTTNCCGLVSAFMIAEDLGCHTDVSLLARQIPVRPAGTSMKELAEYFHSRGLLAFGAELNAAELYSRLEQQPDLRAVALVDEKHWIPLLGATDEKLDAFLYPQRIDVSLGNFRSHYSGKVLLVSRQGIVAGTTMPLLVIAASGVIAVMLFYRQHL